MSSGISFSGLGSGLDTESIVSQLMAIERRPLNRLETKVDSKKQSLNIYSDLKSKLNSLKSLVTGMNTVKEFRRVSAYSGEEDIFTVSADSTAGEGRHSIKVQQLAQAEMEVSQGFATTDSNIGTGTFLLTVGDDDPVEITIDSTNNDLVGLMEAINASDADVTASIMNDGDASAPYRLVVTSNETGTDNALDIDASGLTGGTTPAFTDGSGGTAGQQAQNALLIFDGVSVSKNSNEIDDLISGVTINLHDVDTTKSYELKVESDLDGITESINEFVSKYNEIYDYLDGKIGTDSLQGDYTVNSIKRQLQSMVTGSVENIGGQYSSLANIGITTDSSGHLSVDSDDLEAALENNFEDVMQIFTVFGTADNSKVEFLGAGSSAGAGNYDIVVSGSAGSFTATINGVAAEVSSDGTLIYGANDSDYEGLMFRFSGTAAGDYGTVSVSLGIMEKLDRLIGDFTNVSDGLLKSKEESINRSIRYLEMDIDKKEAALEKVEARLKAQFTKMESMLSQLQSQSGYLAGLGS